MSRFRVHRREFFGKSLRVGAAAAFALGAGRSAAADEEPLFVAGYTDPMSYLFGNILLISKGDLWLVAALDVLTVGVGVLFYPKLLAVCFDDEYVRLRGVRVELYFLLLLGLTALTVVLMVRVVGIVMVIALLTLPAAVAAHFSRRLWQMMGLAVVCCLIFTAGGMGFSYAYDLPSGPTIIVFSGAVYLLVALASRFWRLRGR